VRLDRLLRDEQMRGDLMVEEPVGDEFENFELALGGGLLDLGDRQVGVFERCLRRTRQTRRLLSLARSHNLSIDRVRLILEGLPPVQPSVCSVVAAIAPDSACGSSNVKIEPPPGSDVTQIRPPIRSTSSRQM
jgi:hypothetical protein